ncbi:MULTISPECIES: cupin domain-containing protein [Streptomyces]|uniref:cupin domain-containing protein n=1 Tax=Streptomyces TaxID=1883 RepID=UPI00240CECFD|nr:MULTISPECIES: cupin domain-containing protein [Streptomyces]WFB85370.1 cupin domain-containing protein [Streptomyces olivaceus]WGK49006.1 cupin domain-containing protein [Streptomyces sp. B146]
MHDHSAEHSLDHSTDDSVDRPRSGSFTPAVLRPRELTPFSRGGGARTIPLVTRAVGAEVFLTGQTLFDGGAGIARHIHNCPESVTVLEGDAVVEIDGTEHHVTRFDTTYVPAGTPHHFRNASATAPLRILWIYASVDATRTLVETGVTTRVDAEHDKRVRARASEDGRRPGSRPG